VLATPVAVLRELVDDALEHNPEIAAMARAFDAMMQGAGWSP